jgi:DNA-binding response OmpR family regulator
MFLNAKILIVDDEQDVIKALYMRLKSTGYEVISATDGLMATQLAVQEQPDLILLDIGMPVGDGHTVAQRLRDNVKTTQIPIIFLTARANQEDMKKATDVGAAGYILKPFKSERLLAVVQRVLSEHTESAAVPT